MTSIENRFRKLGGDAGYTGGFVEHYLLPVLYPQVLTRPMQVILGALVLILNVIGYSRLWHRRSSGTF